MNDSKQSRMCLASLVALHRCSSQGRTAHTEGISRHSLTCMQTEITARSENSYQTCIQNAQSNFCAIWSIPYIMMLINMNQIQHPDIPRCSNIYSKVYILFQNTTQCCSQSNYVITVHKGTLRG